MNTQHNAETSAPVIRRLRTDCNANDAVAAMRKLIAQQAPDLRATLEQTFEDVVTAVEAVRDQLQSDWRAARSDAEKEKAGSAAARDEPMVLCGLTAEEQTQALQIAEAFQPGEKQSVRERIVKIHNHFFVVCDALRSLVQAAEKMPLDDRGVTALQDAQKALGPQALAATDNAGERSLIQASSASTKAMSPVQMQLVQHRVRGGAREDESRALLDEQVRSFAAENLAGALMHHGFARSWNADRLAAALLAERSAGNS